MSKHSIPTAPSEKLSCDFSKGLCNQRVQKKLRRILQNNTAKSALFWFGQNHGKNADNVSGLSGPEREIMNGTIGHFRG
jgi:hypothetical protein